ncbi:MAG: hypothetical protein RBS05_20115 [Zoogloea oleivorans]|jgi:hypothetical protein|uniref:glycosyltransferase n=1 Tax=Zoogloea oleivorans TaxID=1552750 RepID=UPI002A36C234|nr:glycosyltransferase [Zoogloea oleivorans]MDY0038222.1 hypothetical protein [Zoogloea oleivorans]
MSRISYWSHFTPESRSAAGQRMRSFVAKLTEEGHTVTLLGGGYQSGLPTWRRLLEEARRTLTTRAQVHIVSLPPYRSAIVQAVLMAILPGRRLIIDQRDLVLAAAPELERRLERAFIHRADALIVTTQAQRREMARRYGKLPPTTLIRNGASDDLATLPESLHSRRRGEGRLRVLYQGLVGGKKLKDVTMRLAALGCDLDLAVFVDTWSQNEVEAIERSWNGVGSLTIHANRDARQLARLMDGADVALNPIPSQMDYAFTVKTADYAVRSLPQLVIGSRRSVSRRAVELCRLGHAIDTVEALDKTALLQTMERFQRRTPDALRVFRRETHGPRLLRLLQEIGR